MADTYDVVVIGAGPAGATAATLLAKQGRATVLLDRSAFPRSGVCAGWLSTRAVPILESMGLPVDSILQHPFTDVAFYNADCSRVATPVFPQPPGFLIDRTAFNNTLVASAQSAGVQLDTGTGVISLDRLENSVVANLEGGRSIVARQLILASGGGTPLLHASGIRAPQGGTTIRSCTVATQLAQTADAGPQVAVVLGLDRAGSSALLVALPNRITITLNWLGPESETRPTLARVCRLLHANQRIAVDLTDAAMQAPISTVHASPALEMESHVGKHLLVVGDAGGFAAVGSMEGLYPAMWSAQIAAEVAGEALDSAHRQDALMTFEPKWRHAMADYLRAPSTDIHFLLPLIFSKQAMADRIGESFFCGKGI